MVFEGGKTMTSTDIAVASGFCENIGNKERVRHITEDVRIGSLKDIKRKIEAAVDRMKLSVEDQLVVLVGGGSILVKPEGSETLKGASNVICPKYCQVANAVGAALSKVSGTFDQVIPMGKTTREEARQDAEREARRKAVEAGADEQTLEVIDVMDVPLAYLPGNAVRYYLKVVGDLAESKKTPGEFFEPGKRVSGREPTGEPASIQEAPYLAVRGSVEDRIVFRDPYVDPSSGDWILNEFDIECIAIGAGIMGCGGGGSPYLGRLKALEIMKARKEIEVIHPNRLGSSPELTGPVAMPALMGAPVIDLEKLFNGQETTSALQAVQAILFNGNKIKERDVAVGIRIAENVEDLMSQETEQHEPHKKIVAIVCADIGGINSMEPLISGATLGLPIVDADGIGRAFPELQMTLPFVYGSSSYPAAFGDEKEKVVAVTYAESPKHLENFFRQKTVDMGCASGLAFVLGWKDVKERCNLFSLSRTWWLGNSVLRARHNKASPVDTILEHENGKLLITGKIADASRVTEGAFTRGSLTIHGSGQFSGTNFGIQFENENYVAFKLKPDDTKDILDTVPDLITVVDEDTGQPMTTEEVRYGLRVAVIAMPCSPLWTTPQGLATVGPTVFGYKGVDYSPISVYKEHSPVPLP